MFATLFTVQGLLIDTAALAAVALVGYLVGRRRQKTSHATTDMPLLLELAKGQGVSKELEHISQRVRVECGGYLRNLAAFQGQIAMMQRGEAPAAWQALREQADSLLGPTLKLTTTLSLSCDELRQQQAQLMKYAGTRIDPETGLRNRRAMSEHLEALLSAHADGERRLALGLFSFCLPLDAPQEVKEEQLKAAAHLLEHCVRGNDVVARYSQDEFVVLMPKTPLAGSLVFAERLARLIDAEMECPVWGGLVEAAPGESPEKLLSRADSALYSARTHDEACLYLHNGLAVRRHGFELRPLVKGSSDEAVAAAHL